MSLPTAPKDISEHPMPTSVVEPVDRNKVQRDIDRKIRFYGIIAAMRQSKLPTNDQMNHFFDWALARSPVQIEQLSPDGQKLIQDSRDIIQTFRELINEKNGDELLQNFVWRTRDVRSTVSGAQTDPNSVLPVDQEKAKNDTQQAMRHMRTLLNLVFTNSEVRKLFSDFGVIGRDIFARGAAKVADIARPDDAQLQNVDQPGPNNEFVTEGGRRVGTDETPVSYAFRIRLPQHLLTGYL